LQRLQSLIEGISAQMLLTKLTDSETLGMARISLLCLQLTVLHFAATPAHSADPLKSALHIALRMDKTICEEQNLAEEF
jgi:hypothetical protein